MKYSDAERNGIHMGRLNMCKRKIKQKVDGIRVASSYIDVV